MYQKRGMFIVVLVLLLINSNLVLAPPSTRPADLVENDQGNFAVRAIIDEVEPTVGDCIIRGGLPCAKVFGSPFDTPGADVTALVLGITGWPACNTQKDNGRYAIGADSCSKIVPTAGDSNVDNCVFTNKLPNQGCWVHVVDPDGGNTCNGRGSGPNGCGEAIVNEGRRLTAEYTSATFSNPLSVKVAQGNDNDPDWMCAFYDINEVRPTDDFYNGADIADYKSDDGFDYICSYDHFWHRCTKDKLNSYIWAADDLYVCETDSSSNPVWKIKGKDRDHDKYVDVTGQDCADDPLSSGLKVGDDCPAPGKTCDPVIHSACAYCINPGAPEVCGDGQNNDCKNDTLDSCHANEFACERKAPQTKPNPADPTAPAAPAQSNIYGDTFSWLKVNNPPGGYCCGYDGLGDLGKIMSEKSTGNSYVCLNKNKDVVGYDGENPEPPGWRNECKEDWCWVQSSTNSQFKVITIKKNPAKPYDVVSNGKDWVECSEINKKPKLAPPTSGSDIPALKKGSSRFQCYQAGNYWAWAECGKTAKTPDQARDTTNHNVGIKGRSPGEGLYTLPLTEGNKIKEEIKDQAVIQISADTQLYKKHYGNEFLFDFSGYDSLNFMVKFKKDFLPPANIKLTISGPGDTKYFEKNVLGNVINNPLFKQENYMHVQVALPKNPELKGVKQLLFESTNFMTIRNVYLSSATDNYLCSGEESELTGQSAWLRDIDEGDPSPTAITGKDLCIALYSNKAWLGNDLEVSSASANCCGNTGDEYYGGKSKPTGDPANRYACWNGQPVASGETIMDVEFRVVYDDNDFTVTYPTEKINIDIMQSCNYLSGFSENAIDFGTWIGSTTVGAMIGSKLPNFKQVSDLVAGACPGGTMPTAVTTLTPGTFFAPPDKLSQVFRVESNQFNYILFHHGSGVVPTTLQLTCQDQKTESVAQFLTEPKIGLVETPKANTGNPTIVHFNIDKLSTSSCPVDAFSEYQIKNSNSNTSAYWLDRNGVKTGVSMQGVRSLKELTLGIELDQSQYKPLSLQKQSPPQTKTVKYTCNQNECLYPLPGKPHYTITNTHPGLYDLYFVRKPPGGEELITSSKTFNEEGNIKAKKISQQVLFYNDGSNIQQPGFFGCSAASFVVGPNQVEVQNNLQHCQVKGEQVCAYSKTDANGITTINAWTKEALPETYGVDPVRGEAAGYVSLAGKPAKNLTNPSLVVPAKNLLANAEFNQFTTGDLIGWEILNANGVPVQSEPGFIQTNMPSGVLSVLGGGRLRTERIPVEQNMDLFFDINSTGGCGASIIFVDKDGVTQRPTFLNKKDKVNTANAAYFILEITGCEFSQPTIQYVDSKGPSQFGFKDPKDKPRAAAACCPKDYCWNGYACAAPMTAFTTLKISEDAGNGKNYRCIKGQWTFQSPKTDWKEDEVGFCNENTDCYVLSSISGGDPANKAGDFYQGKYPACIKSGEYIFDNYCDNGKWTSRTKFLASQLLEKIGEGRDHTLYCTYFRDVFTNLNDDQLGKLKGVETSLNVAGLGEEQAKVCFPKVSSGEGSRLVSDKENTCINNVCVVKVGRNTAFSTTLNKKLDDPNSFAGALGRSTPTCAGTADFKDCQNGLFYNDVVKAVWYSQDNFNPNQGIFKKVVELLKSILEKKGKLTGENFFSKVDNFKEVYSFKQGNKRVLGLKEEISRSNKTLLVEFENFNTPVCDYLKPSRLNRRALELELLQQASGVKVISCKKENTIQRVEAIADADFLWPQLTAKLRTS